jgi:YbbR domain-containing protein
MDKWLRNNNIVKGIALLIGILLWFVVHLDVAKTSTAATPLPGEQTITNVKVVPTRFDASHFSIQEIDPAEVNITLRGKQTALTRLDTTPIQVQVDLSNATVGKHSYPLRAVNIPSTLTSTLVPMTVMVTLEELQKKEIPVSINVVGTPAAGYKVGQPIVNPNRVHVTLRTSQLDNVDSVRADVNVDKATGVISKQVKLTAYGKDGKAIEAAITPPVVDVEVPITLPFKEMPLQIKLIGQPAKGFSVAAMTQSVKLVTVYGSQDNLDKMEFYDGPLVDLTDLKESKQVTLDIPVLNKDIRVEPAKVNISLDVVPSAAKTLDNIPLRISGENDSYVTKLVTPALPSIQATLEGAPALLDKITVQDVQAIVDVSNLAPGKHDLYINLNLPAFIYKSDVQPQILRATVEITAKVAAASKPPGTSGSPSPIISASPTPAASPSP